MNFVQEHLAGRDLRPAIESRLKFVGRKPLCPFPGHNDQTPGSVSIDWGRGLIHCFSCGKGGDIVTLAQMVDGGSEADAISTLKREFDLNGDGHAEKPPQAPPPDARKYWDRFSAEDPEGIAYLTSRGLWPLPPDSVRFVPRQLYRIAVPLFNPAGEIVNVQCRPALPREEIVGKPFDVMKGAPVAGTALGRLVDDRPVWIVEGLTDYLAATLMAEGLGVCVLGVPGVANAAGLVRARAAQLRQRTVYVSLDNDEPGARGAKEAVQALQEAGAEPRLASYPAGFKDLAEIVEKLGREETLGVMHEVFAAAGNALALQPASPQPALPGESDNDSSEELPELDPAALYGLAGEIVRTVDPHTEAHPAAVLMHMLAMFGNAVGRSPHFRIGGAFHHANIFVAIVGPTGTGRKGTSAEWPLRILHMAEGDDWRHEGGLSTGEGLIASVADLSKQEIEDEVPPRDKRLFCLETEFGRTLRVSKREANTLFPVIQQFWETGDAGVKTKKPIRATDAHVSIAVHAAPDVLLERLDALNAAEGFANRFLFCYSHRTKRLPEGGSLTDVDLRPLVARVAKALDEGHKLYEFKRDEEARAFWRVAYDSFPEHTGLLGEVTNRAIQQTVRLALIYALFDCEKTSEPVIRRGHLEAALALWRYSLDSAKFVFGTKTGNLLADRIHAECLAAYPEALTDAEVYGIFQNHINALQLETAAAALKSAGLVERTIGKGLGRGRGKSSGLWKATRP